MFSGMFCSPGATLHDNVIITLKRRYDVVWLYNDVTKLRHVSTGSRSSEIFNVGVYDVWCKKQNKQKIKDKIKKWSFNKMVDSLPICFCSNKNLPVFTSVYCTVFLYIPTSLRWFDAVGQQSYYRNHWCHIWCKYRLQWVKTWRRRGLFPSILPIYWHRNPSPWGSHHHFKHILFGKPQGSR